jgi:hypothetical protein
LAASAATLCAQTTGTLAGTVTSADAIPLANARVQVVGTTLATFAGTSGAFQVALVPRGTQTLDVRMLGYAPILLPIDVRVGETLRVHVRLEAVDPVALSAVEVIAPSIPALRGFEERRSHGPGTFFTREEIQRMQPRQLTDVLRRVPGLQVRPIGGAYGDNILVTSRGSRCPVMFFLNGSPFPVPNDIPVNHFISVDEVVAIEVYSPSETPPQFNSSMYGARCGLVGVWTRSGR